MEQKGLDRQEKARSEAGKLFDASRESANTARGIPALPREMMSAAGAGSLQELKGGSPNDKLVRETMGTLRTAVRESGYDLMNMVREMDRAGQLSEHNVRKFQRLAAETLGHEGQKTGAGAELYMSEGETEESLLKKLKDKELILPEGVDQAEWIKGNIQKVDMNTARQWDRALREQLGGILGAMELLGHNRR